MKTAVCCIIKDENAYLREFVEWYKNLGFDNIVLYDNNFSDGEDIHESIGDYIENGYVKVIEIKDQKVMQLPAYNDCIVKFGPEYDWIGFFDCDEHLHLEKHKNIQEFLSEFGDDVDSVVVNWMIMDDNDLLDNDGRLLEDRFTRIANLEYCSYPNIKENQHIKTILKCGNNMLNARFTNPHFVIGINKCVTAKGENIPIGSWHTRDVDWSVAYLKHFCRKTISEYINNKILKGAPDIQYATCINNRLTIDNFWKTNTRTKEKEELAEQLLEEIKPIIENRKKQG